VEKDPQQLKQRGQTWVPTKRVLNGEGQGATVIPKKKKIREVNTALEDLAERKKLFRREEGMKRPPARRPTHAHGGKDWKKTIKTTVHECKEAPKTRGEVGYIQLVHKTGRREGVRCKENLPNKRKRVKRDLTSRKQPPRKDSPQPLIPFNGSRKKTPRTKQKG